jgi:ribosomal protein S6--L-glutamate ligase
LLTKDGVTRFIYDHQFSLNHTAARDISHDKCAAAAVLAYYNIPHAAHIYIERSAGCDMEDIYKLLTVHGELVFKKNTGTGGRDIFRVRTPAEADEAAGYLLQRFNCMAVSPYYDIRAEYRAVMLDNTVELVYEKVRPIGEWRHNLQHGAVPRAVLKDEPEYAAVTELAGQAALALGLRFASLDIIVHGLLPDERWLVLEINAGVMMEYFAGCSPECYRLAEAIYAKAVRKLFA